MSKIRKKSNNLTVLASILISIIPVLSPYAVFGISIVWIIGILYIMYVLILSRGRKIRLNRKILSYFSFPIICFIISFNGFLVLENIINLFNQLIGLIIVTLIFYCLWLNSDYQMVYKISNRIAYVCGIFAVVQVLMILTGNVVPSGRIECFQLVSGQSWVPETWGFRINSLFSEPSYFAIYLLPLFTANLVEKNYKNSIIFGLLIILSSSTLGIIGACVVIGWEIFIVKSDLKSKLKTIAFILSLVGILAVILVNNNGLNTMFMRTIDKLYNIGSGENSMRISGYISYFSNYDVKETLFGVGMSQFKNYFAERNIFLHNYSNSIVMMLLQYGIVGTAFSILYYGYLGLKSIKRKSFVFFLLLIITMSIDYVTFSYRYYYLLYFALFFVKRPQNILPISVESKSSFC